MQAQYAYRWYNPTNPNENPYTTEGAWKLSENSDDLIKLQAIDILKESNQYANRISIYAPPGTQFLINNKKFIVGHSGILDLGDNKNKDLLFQELCLQQIRTVQLDKDITKGKIENGLDQMSRAISYLLDVTNATISKREDSEGSQWQTEFNTLGFEKERPEAIIINSEAISDYFSQFKNDFDKGYSEYMVGRRGIYKPVGTDYIPLQNIIIDINYITLE